jgi:sortase A
MAIRKIYPEDLTVRQVHYLILERRRTVRNTRLEHFHRTGRVVPFVAEMSSIEDRRSWLGTQKEKCKGIPKLRRTWFDRILTLMELAAIIGLVSILVSGLTTLSSFNQSVAESFRQPAPEPTPIIQAVVLPDGHTPPNGPGGARPNGDEIPEHLRPLWQSLSNLPTQIPAPEQAIRIQIPAISVDAPVVQGDSWEQLKKGVGQQVGTPDPGKNGNVVLSGHNDVYGEVFRYLNRLSPGDSIILFTSQRQYIYIVAGMQVVEPTAVEVMAPTPDARVTLISCHPYLVNDHRIVVSAVLQSL